MVCVASALDRAICTTIRRATFVRLVSSFGWVPPGIADLARTAGYEWSFPLLNHLSSNQDMPTFPVGLLITGYGTAYLSALLLSTHGVGILATGLTFWLGGAVAVLGWGCVWACSSETALA